MNSDCPSNMMTLSNLYIAGLRTQKDGEDLQHWPNKFVRVPSTLQIDHPLRVIFHQAISQLSKSTHHHGSAALILFKQYSDISIRSVSQVSPLHHSVACPVLGCATPRGRHYTTTVIEESQSWPSSLTTGYLSLIPKPDSDNSPSSLRVVSCLRKHAPVRTHEMARILGSCVAVWFPFTSFMFGCLVSACALSVEKSLLLGEPLVGCMLDFEKAFDLLPLHEIILPLAKVLGLPPTFVDTLSNLYSRLSRFLKHSKGFGSCIPSNRGIVQGCPISVVLLNLLVSVFLRFAEAPSIISEPSHCSGPPAGNTGQIHPQAYADDISASSTLDTFLQKAGSFALVTGQRLKVPKCKVWSTQPQLNKELKLLRLAQKPLDVVSDIRYLGAQFGFHPGMPKVAWNSKISKSEHLVTCNSGQSLASICRRQDVIAAAPIARLFHGCELSSLDFDSLKKLRTTVFRTLWTGRSGRIPEILTCLIFLGHRCDPIQVVAFRSFSLSALSDPCVLRILADFPLS